MDAAPVQPDQAVLEIADGEADTLLLGVDPQP
jgi:hypothetical protein